MLSVALVGLGPEAWLLHALRARGLDVGATSPGIVARLAGLAITALPMAIAVYGLWQMRAPFRLYQRGRVFEREPVTRLRRFAAALFAHAVAMPVSGAAVSVCLTFANAPGERQRAFGVGSGELYAAFLGGVFLVIAWIMSAAASLAEDSAGIV